METPEKKNDVLADKAETKILANVEANKGKTSKTNKATKEKVTVKEKALEKGKGVAVWQKGLRPLRDLVNMAQLNGETIKNKIITDTLSKLARAERIRIEASETIPARLNRRFLKFCKG